MRTPPLLSRAPHLAGGLLQLYTAWQTRVPSSPPPSPHVHSRRPPSRPASPREQALRASSNRSRADTAWGRQVLRAAKKALAKGGGGGGGGGGRVQELELPGG